MQGGHMRVMLDEFGWKRCDYYVGCSPFLLMQKGAGLEC